MENSSQSIVDALGGTSGPLAGRFVLDFSENLPGPFATLLLAQWGATVLKVEKPGGEAGRYHPTFPYLAAGKRSLELDLRATEGRSLALALAPMADVVVEGFRPGVAARLGIGYDDITAVNKRVIYCSISGYGQEGDQRNTAGHDINYLSEGGYLSDHRDGEGNQVTSAPPGHVADYISGVLAAASIAAQLADRTSARSPVHLDIALADAALVPAFASLAFAARNIDESIASRHYPHYRSYATSDDRHITLGITSQEQAFWDRLVTHLGFTDLIGLGAAERKRDSIVIARRLSELFGSQPLAFWEKNLAGLDVPWSVVRTPGEVVAKQRVAARPVLDPDHQAFDVLHSGSRGSAPELGEANALVEAFVADVVTRDRT